MRKIILLVMVLLPGMAFAATDCRIVEYPDHTEAVCVGDAEQTPASHQTTGQQQIPGQEQAVASAETPEMELPDVPPEKIVRNELARLHGSYVLNSHSSQ